MAKNINIEGPTTFICRICHMVLFDFTNKDKRADVHGALRGDKSVMLTYTYPHKRLGKIKVTICNHQADSPLCGLMSSVQM